ncbi:MAG: hypothetical protein OXR66_07610 [Candidatus Woesearchaeota archaeon]|nr:hypothetical protein [Candidatus Woesearchaeota archaeon]
MAFLDKLKNLTKKFKKGAPAKKVFVLQEDEIEQWPDQVATQYGMDAAFEEFQTAFKARQTQVIASLAPFTDEAFLAKIPERARTVNAVNAKSFADATKPFLQARFTSLETFEHDHDDFMEQVNVFANHVKTSTAVLQEFFKTQLTVTQEHIKELEDSVIKAVDMLDKHGYSTVKTIREKLATLSGTDERREKYKELMEALITKRDTVEQKRAKLEKRIDGDRGKIRNKEALPALEKLQALEQELHDITTSYVNVCKNVKKYLKKHEDITLEATAQQTINELPKNPEQYIRDHQGDVFSIVADQLEQHGRGAVGNLIDRLRSFSPQKDATRIEAILPEQTQLKQLMMKDIAALNIYDKQQFLLRAKQEEKELAAKITFLQAELDGGERLLIKREIKDAVLAMGITVQGGAQIILDEVMDKDDVESDDELDKAFEETQMKEEKLEEELDEEDAKQKPATDEHDDVLNNVRGAA